MTNRTVAAVFDRYEDASEAVSELEAAGIALATSASFQTTRPSGRATRSPPLRGLLTATAPRPVPALAQALAPRWAPGLAYLPAWVFSLSPALGRLWRPDGLRQPSLERVQELPLAASLEGLAGAGIDETHAHSYAEAVNRGGTLVTVRADASNHDRIVDILDDDGTVDMAEREASWRSEGWTGKYVGPSASRSATETVGDAVSDTASSIGRAATRAGEKVSDAAASAGKPMGLSDRDRTASTPRDASRTTRVRSYPLI